MLPIEILREAVGSYTPYLQASGEIHDPVFGEPTQYGTPYHAFCNAVLAREDGGERRSAYAHRAVRGLEPALDPGLPPTASGFDGATGAVERSNHKDFFWPPILKTFLIRRDLGAEGADGLADMLAEGYDGRRREAWLENQGRIKHQAWISPGPTGSRRS